MKCQHGKGECNKIDTSGMDCNSCESCKSNVSDLVKFSPGKWEGSSEDGLGTYVNNVKTNVICSPDREFWLALVQCETMDEEAEANTRLILNAPAMFWELVKMARSNPQNSVVRILSDICGEKLSYSDIERLDNFNNRNQ